MSTVHFTQKTSFKDSSFAQNIEKNDIYSILFAVSFHILLFSLLFLFKDLNLLFANKNNVSSQSIEINYEMNHELTQNKSQIQNINSGSSSAKSVKSQTKKKIFANKKSKTQKLASNSDNIQKSEVIYNDPTLDNKYPTYPTRARRRGEEGEVIIKAFIDKIGRAVKIEVMKSSLSEELDFAALKAIKKWKFIPAKKLGNSIDSSVIIPVIFKLNNDVS